MAERNQKSKVTSGQNLGFAILIIIILALIVLNFGNITGKATAQSDSGIKVSVQGSDGNDLVEAGDYIYVTIDPGNKGTYNYQPKIFDEFGNYIGIMTVANCGPDCTVKREAKYLLPTNLAPGVYEVRVYDRTRIPNSGGDRINKHIVASFVVKYSYN